MELKRTVDKVQEFIGSRHSHTGPPRGETSPGDPEEHQLGSGTAVGFILE